MKSPRGNIGVSIISSLLLGLLFAVVAGPTSVLAQNNIAIPQGSLIIAMDNYRQGNDAGPAAGTGDDCAGPEFNIRAYGYAVRLLHQSVKLRWIINNAKTANTTNDITGINVTQLPVATYGGQACTQGAATNVSFAGGPLVIAPEDAAAAKSLLISYNSTSANNDVRVYEVNSTNFTVPTAYVTEITHKPFVAVGPDCTVSSQCLSNSVYERLYVAAGLQQGIHYVPVANNTFSDYCVTLAAQAHAQSDAAANLTAFSNHVQNGGNLMLQCLSADIYDETVLPGGNRYFTSGGISNSVFANDPPNSLPTLDTGAVQNSNPFNQFVGALGRANGYTDYSGSFLAATTRLARDSGDTSDWIAMTRDVLPLAIGGQVFGLGGHEYGGYSGDSVDNPGGSGPIVFGGELARVNGSRMALNALLYPAQPACALVPPSVQGYKTVKLGTAVGDDANNNGVINLQDNVEWTVRYINTGNSNIANFQITDQIDNRLTFLAGTLSAFTQASSAAAQVPVGVNNSFNGTTTLTMLNPAITLNAGAMITVKFKTKVIVAADIPNQASASGTGIPTPVATDSADMNTPGSTNGYLIAADCANSPNCYNQSPWVSGDPVDNWTAAIEPTYISLSTVPTAAGVEVGGSVLDSNGRGIAREQIVLQNATTGELTYATTNSFGHFRFLDVPVGDFYLLSVNSRRYTYETPTVGLSLEDSITGISFVASPLGGRGGSGSLVTNEKKPVVDDVEKSAPVKAAPAAAAPAQATPAKRRTVYIGPSKTKEVKEGEEPTN